jgi:iron complex transport system ATP-binding protein
MRLTTESLTVGRGGRTVLSGVDLTVAPGEVLGLLGPNGAGKTTLLRALAGIDPAMAGTVVFDGAPLLGIDRLERARSIGFLPQPPEAVWPVSVENLVGLGRLPFSGPFGRPNRDDRAAIEEALVSCDLLALRDRSIAALSAGEASRAFLARVLAGRPRLLLADEPTANLDPAHQLAVMETMRKLATAGATVIMSQHDLPLACRFCDRLVLLAEGRVVAQGRPRDVATSENLARVFRVAAHFAEGPDDAFFALPWSLVPGTIRDDIVGL